METVKRDYSISAVRLLAMLCIIACHMMQFLDCELAWWFNVGVQIFLCISGYLYGGKGIANDLGFYKRTFLRLMVDYYVVTIPVIVLYFVFARGYISVSLAVQALLTASTLKGGGHLWFVSTILLCYFLTPLYAQIFDRLENRKNWAFGSVTVVLLLAQVVVFTEFFYFFKTAWINCYLLGFVLRRIRRGRRMRLEKLCVGAIFALGIVLNGVQIVIDHVLRLDMSGSLSWLYSSMCDHAHGLLGIMLFVLLKRIFDSLFSRGVPKGAIRVLSVSDAYSYDVYLVHQFMILGPFTLMELTPYLGLNILLILTGTCVLAWVVHGISDRARQGVQRLLNRAWTAAESMEGQA